MALDTTVFDAALDSDGSPGSGEGVDKAFIEDVVIIPVNAEIARLDADIAAGGGVVITGTPADNRIAVWTSASAIEGPAGLTFDGTTLTTPGQIAFPATQNPSANANTLDDYKELDWTPVIGGSGGTSGQTYSTQVGKGTKKGRELTLTFRATLSAKGTITGTVQLLGVPVDPVAGGGALLLTFYDAMATAVVSMTGIYGGAGAWTLYMRTAAATSGSTLTTTDISNTTDLSGILVIQV